MSYEQGSDSHHLQECVSCCSFSWHVNAHWTEEQNYFIKFLTLQDGWINMTSVRLHIFHSLIIRVYFHTKGAHFETFITLFFFKSLYHCCQFVDALCLWQMNEYEYGNFYQCHFQTELFIKLFLKICPHHI